MADSKAMLWIALLRIMPSLLCLIGQCYLKTWGNRFSFRRASSKHPLFLFWFCLFIYQWVIFSLISSLVHGLFSSVQSFSCIQLFATPWMAACQASLSITNSQSCSNSRPSSQWCHPTISSSVILFCPCLQSFLASGSFPVSQSFASGGWSIRASTSA